MATPVSFTPEAVASTSRNYLERLVGDDGLPYSNVFWTDPPEAAHDWPDFGSPSSEARMADVSHPTAKRL